jgi:divalent metal cation (Fe/Co/Zn/Cd) transporter
LVGGSGSSSKKAVYAALFGNLGIAIAKLAAATITGSTAMFVPRFPQLKGSQLFFILLLLLTHTNQRKEHG